MEETSNSPAAKNQRLDISTGQIDQDVPQTDCPKDESNSSGQLDNSVAAQAPSPLDLPTNGHFANITSLSDSQLDGQVDHDIRKHELTSPEMLASPKKFLSDEQAKEKPEISEPEKSKLPEASAVDGAAAAFERNSIYHVKWVGWRRNSSDPLRRIGIITQNENGPCPLLSIVNVLLLRGKLTLPEGCEVISAEQLLEFLGKSLFYLTHLLVVFEII